MAEERDLAALHDMLPADALVHLRVARGALAVFTILLQPYYNFGFNDLRSGLHPLEY